MSHPFRFAVQLSRATSGPSWRNVARKIEDLGYSTLFVPDHFDDQFGPLVALTVAAEATSTLRVGSLVFGNDYRHPVVLAKEVATLDLVSEGRVEFGLGAGWMSSDYRRAGIPEESPGVRIGRMAESLAIITSLWSTGSVAFTGEHYRVSGELGMPTPHQRPHPPIIIGGGGRRVLGIAGREADIVGVNPSLASGHIGAETIATTAAEHYHQRVAWIREAAGERFDQLELQCLTVVVQVTPNRTEAVEQVAKLIDRTPAEVNGSPIALIGTVDQIVDQLRLRRDLFGFSYIVVHEADIEPFAPVVAALVGI